MIQYNRPPAKMPAGGCHSGKYHLQLSVHLYLFVGDGQHGVAQERSGVILGIRPVRHKLPGQDHRHPVVDEGDAVRGRAGEYDELRPPGGDAIQPREVEQPARLRPDRPAESARPNRPARLAW